VHISLVISYWLGLFKVYRDLCKIHKTFRERSENAEVAAEIRFGFITSIFPQV